MPTPVQAIRKKCIDCSGGVLSEIRNCVVPNCPLFPFRMGKNPNRKPGLKCSNLSETEG